jgi:predicted nucleic acid-binding Zn ribbon protein
MLLGVVCAAPVLLDAFRGFSVAAHMDGTKEERRETLAQEQKRREQGMVVTFALATATLLITLLSLLIGLL